MTLLNLSYLVVMSAASFALSASAVAAGTLCPLDPPGSAVPHEHTAFMSQLDNHLESMRNGTCRTAEGFDCNLVSWSSVEGARYPNCAPYFFDAQGNEGPLGRMVTSKVQTDIETNEARGQVSPFAQDYPDLIAPNVCPGFSKMSDSEKVFFWGWFFEILANFESHCDQFQVNIHKSVPNPPAVGLFQMEGRSKDRKDRPPECHISEAAIRSPEGNTSCAVDIMKTLLRSRGAVFGDPKGSYWHALNRNLPEHSKDPTQRDMLRYLKRFPLCKPVGGAEPESEVIGDNRSARGSRGRRATRRNSKRRRATARHRRAPAPNPPQ